MRVAVLLDGRRARVVAALLAGRPPFARAHAALLDGGYALARLATVKRLPCGALQARLVWRRRADGCCAVMTGQVPAGTPGAAALALALTLQAA